MTLNLHEDGLILSYGGLSAVILLAKAAWAVSNEADVAENVHTASMRTRKS